MNDLLAASRENYLPQPPTDRAARHQEMRKIAQHLNAKMLKFDGLVNPRTAAKAMGISIDGNSIIFEAEWDVDVLAEYSLYYHLSKGVRHFARVLKREPLSSEERAFLETNLRAFVSVFEIQQTRPQLWEIDLVDRLGKRGLVTIVDRNASASMPPGTLLFARILPHQTFNSSSGVALPLVPAWEQECEREFALRRCRAALRSPGKRTPQHALFYICRKLHLRSEIPLEFR